MKVAFDENMPIAMVRVFQALATEGQFRKLGLKIISATDYTPKATDADYRAKNDEPWIKRFAKDGGKVIISGDARMMSVPQERLALLDEGLVVLFFENRWNNWRFFTKCALLLLWMPAIARKVKTARPKTFWRIPSIWDETAKLRQQSTEDPKIEKAQRKHVSRAKERKTKQSATKKVESVVINLEPDFHHLLDQRTEDAKPAPQITTDGQQASSAAETGKP